MCCAGLASYAATAISPTCCACCITPGARRRGRPRGGGPLRRLPRTSRPSPTRGGPELALTARLAYEAIGELSEPLRATVVAVDVVGLSYAEAARALRTRKGTIMSRLFRARAQIAAAVEGM